MQNSSNAKTPLCKNGVMQKRSYVKTPLCKNGVFATQRNAAQRNAKQCSAILIYLTLTYFFLPKDIDFKKTVHKKSKDFLESSLATTKRSVKVGSQSVSKTEMVVIPNF